MIDNTFKGILDGSKIGTKEEGSRRGYIGDEVSSRVETESRIVDHS